MWSIQSNAFEKSVRRAPNWCPLSINSLNFSIITIRHCWALCPFRKLHWFGERMLSKQLYSWLYNIFVYTLEMFVGMLTGQCFSLTHLPFFLCTGITSACFSSYGNSPSSTQWLKLLLINFAKISLLSLMILVEVSVFWQVFVVFNWLIISITSFALVFWKLKLELRHCLVMVVILGCVSKHFIYCRYLFTFSFAVI